MSCGNAGAGGGAAQAAQQKNANIPSINNPAGIPSNAMTEDEFLTLRGVGDSVSGAGIDMIGGANQTRMTERQRRTLQNSMEAERNDYYARREAAREEYKALIGSGQIRDKTPIERMITKAHGNPDLQATQAARRMAKKRGYDWKTGKKLD